jgi:D-alanyl-D-alanine carboxypeptidase
MKSNVLIGVFFLILTSHCAVFRQDLAVNSCPPSTSEWTAFQRGGEIKDLLDELVTTGVPGVNMAAIVHGEWFEASAGLAKVEEKIPMQMCHLQYLQSISKTYLATVILLLNEEGKIELDSTISNYLPPRLSRYVSNAETITIRMLLNHTSGVPEYNYAPGYVSLLLQDPEHIFVAEDYLRYIEHKKLDFKPGSNYSYRNSNYVLLSLIADEITGDHAGYISERIFKPLNLRRTFYRSDPGYLTYEDIPNTYWDRYSNGIIENVSQLQLNNVAAMVGDDGIVTTPHDAVLFLKALMTGEIISPSSLTRMKSWVNDTSGNPTYGLGLDYANFVGHVGYGHSGGGIGAGCQLYYFPAQDTYVFIGVNIGTVTDSPLHHDAMKTLDKIYRILLE